MGYATRMGDPGTIPNDLVDRVSPFLILDGAGSLDREAIVADPIKFRGLVDFVAILADEIPAFVRLARVTTTEWLAFTKGTDVRLRSTMVGNGVAEKILPSRAVAGTLLRLGYSLRTLDEITRLSAFDESAAPLDHWGTDTA